MSEREAGGAVDRDDEDDRDTPTADEVLKNRSSLDEAGDGANEDPEAD